MATLGYVFVGLIGVGVVGAAVAAGMSVGDIKNEEDVVQPAARAISEGGS